MDDTTTLTLNRAADEVPMGGNLLASGEGATFKVWAPLATGCGEAA
jgi:hypothetical protein